MGRPVSSGASGDPTRPSPPALFARRLRHLRQARGWTQADLAQRAAISKEAVSTYERGVKLPHPRTTRRLADALGFPLAELIGDVRGQRLATPVRRLAAPIEPRAVSDASDR